MINNFLFYCSTILIVIVFSLKTTNLIFGYVSILFEEPYSIFMAPIFSFSFSYVLSCAGMKFINLYLKKD